MVSVAGGKGRARGRGGVALSSSFQNSFNNNRDQSSSRTHHPISRRFELLLQPAVERLHVKFRVCCSSGCATLLQHSERFCYRLGID